MVVSFGQKRGMSQVFLEDGRVIPVTIVEIFSDARISALLTQEKDGYNALQVAALYAQDTEKPSLKGEVRLYQKNSSEMEIGASMDASRFESDMKLVVTGVSKGKGFGGVIKRHGFSGKDATHGTKHDERRPGSIGGMFPQNVRPGRKMPGQTGNKNITLKNREVVHVDEDKNTILVKGSLPGPNNGVLKLAQQM